MKHVSRLGGLVALLLVVLTGCFQAIDRDSLSIKVSESTINSAWRVTASRLRIDNLAIDLQPNQVVINGMLTPLQGGAYSAQLIVKPTVSNGTATWSAVSATVNGTAANSEQLTEINSAFLDSWANYIKTHYGEKRITAITITDTEIVYTLGR